MDDDISYRNRMSNDGMVRMAIDLLLFTLNVAVEDDGVDILLAATKESLLLGLVSR